MWVLTIKTCFVFSSWIICSEGSRTSVVITDTTTGKTSTMLSQVLTVSTAPLSTPVVMMLEWDNLLKRRSFSSQAEPLQQVVREEVADRGRPLHRASAHLLLQQDGDETGHDAGGERERRQADHPRVLRLHAVSTTQIYLCLIFYTLTWE